MCTSLEHGEFDPARHAEEIAEDMTDGIGGPYTYAEAVERARHDLAIKCQCGCGRWYYENADWSRHHDERHGLRIIDGHEVEFMPERASWSI